MELVIISGMSGAGKTTVLHNLEDLGFYCADNIPPELMSELALALDKSKSNDHDKVAMVADIRMGELLSGIANAVEKIKMLGYSCKLIFLDANNDVLINRYNLTKRRHPLAGGGTISHGLNKEREILKKIKEMSTYYIDTSNSNEKELKQKIREIFEGEKVGGTNVQLVSFGFKRGMPTDIDMMFDMRFLPNPFYDENLRELTGLVKGVHDYAFSDPNNLLKVEGIARFIESILSDYRIHSKDILSVGIGCTGGKHRSVASTEIIYNYLTRAGIKTIKHHRDILL